MYTFYFDYEGDHVQLPIAPSSFTMKINGKNKVIELLNLGDVNILKDPGLTDLSFNILLPGQEYPFAIYPDKRFRKPSYYTERFKSYKKDKKPILFTITRESPWKELLFDIKMMVSLESYTIEEKAGEEGDLYVALELKEYKEYLTQVVTMKDTVDGKVTATIKKQRPSKTPAKSHTVKSGDTLWAIAKKELNDGSKFSEIAKLNNIKNPNVIRPGQVLKLP